MYIQELLNLSSGTTRVSPLSLLLFGGESIRHFPELQLAVFDRWIATADRSVGGTSISTIYQARGALGKHAHTQHTHTHNTHTHTHSICGARGGSR